MKFFYIYKSLAHPELNGYVQPYTLQERLLHVKKAERTLGSQIPWICDSMENDIKHALGDAPNSEFIIDPQGRVARKRQWSEPAALRKDLEELVGPVDKPTLVSDLKMKTAPPPKAAARGVLPRVERPANLQPLKIAPDIKEGGEPFYAKLRAEASPELLRSGQGKLYLGFHLDPLYQVHWNNLTKPLRVELAAPDEVELSATNLEGPTPDEITDGDPREFLIDIDAGKNRKPLELTVSYFVCNDEEGWCKVLKQRYTVSLEPDRDGGRVRAGRGNRQR